MRRRIRRVRAAVRNGLPPLVGVSIVASLVLHACRESPKAATRLAYGDVMRLGESQASPPLDRLAARSDAQVELNEVDGAIAHERPEATLSMLRRAAAFARARIPGATPYAAAALEDAASEFDRLVARIERGASVNGREVRRASARLNLAAAWRQQGVAGAAATIDEWPVVAENLLMVADYMERAARDATGSVPSAVRTQAITVRAAATSLLRGEPGAPRTADVVIAELPRTLRGIEYSTGTARR